MRWVGQETTNSCGAGVVAMVAGITWADAVRALGTRGCTNYSHLIKALDKIGVEHGEMVRFRKGTVLPESCIVRINWRDGTSHWVVWHGHMCWDPGRGRILPEDFGKWWPPTSYMAVIPKE